MGEFLEEKLTSRFYKYGKEVSSRVVHSAALRKGHFTLRNLTTGDF